MSPRATAVHITKFSERLDFVTQKELAKLRQQLQNTTTYHYLPLPKVGVGGSK